MERREQHARDLASRGVRVCEACNGTGSLDLDDVACGACGGTGEVPL
jgi:DnaJ-class molecular chaperone